MTPPSLMWQAEYDDDPKELTEVSTVKRLAILYTLLQDEAPDTFIVISTPEADERFWLQWHE